MNDVTGMVFDIKKFAIHDGPGIRTTVFMKGCPLRCLWCHNPESISPEREISLVEHKCIGCGWCFDNCPNHAHINVDGKRVFNRDKCTRCGICSGHCYAGALEVVGTEMRVTEVIEEVMKDKPFYDNSDGGMTLSGGEPMLQFEFTKALLQAAKGQGLHCCLDTCGFAQFERYQELFDNVDIFLYDLKETDPDLHNEYTGVPLQPILDNLIKLSDAGADIWLRCPVVPGLNDRSKHFIEIGRIAESCQGVKQITIHPYHPLGSSKSKNIGKEYDLKDKKFAEKTDIEAWVELISANTSKPVSSEG